MKLARLGIFLSVVAAVVLVIGVSGALLLPHLIDSQIIKDRIRSELEKTTVSMTFDKVALLWFPRPSVVIDNAELSFADKNQGSIRTLRIYPSIFYLLTGRLVVRRASLQEPKFRVYLPESLEKPLDLEELEKQIRSALVRFTGELLAPRLDVSDGAAEIRIGDKPPVILENVAAQIVDSPGGLRFELSARSSLCDQFKIEGKISPESLAAQLDIGLRRLKIKESLALLPLQIFQYARQGEASLDVNIASVGLRKVKASIGGSVGPFVFDGHGGTVTAEVKRLTGGMSYEGGVLQVDVEQMDLASPRLQASGELKVQAGSLSARVNVRDADIAEVSEMALRTVGETEDLKKILQYVPAGKISEMSIQSAGPSVANLASSKNMVVSAVMRSGKIYLPGPDLELQNVAGSVRIADGVLEANNLSANLGAMRGTSGNLRLGFEGKSAPFHLDIVVQTGAPELQSVLLKLVRDKAFREELLKVRNVEGELSGRLILGETIDAISSVVAISKADISATYEPVPFPIVVRGGRFNYDQKIITLEDAQGSVGRSTFGGLGVTLHHDGSRQIKVDSKRVLVDLQQSEALLRSFKDSGAYFAKLQSTRGHIELENLALTGAYDNPAGWTFASAGTLNQVEIRHADFPGRIRLAHGKFAANHGRVRFSDVSAAMSDGALIASGTFEYAKGGLSQIETSATGTVGALMTQWISHQVELPEDLGLRSPLKISAGRLAWRAGGDISFRGQVTVAGGPQLALDVVKQPHGLDLRNLTIDDGVRRARMTFQRTKDHLDLSFSGELTQQTIDKVFASFPMEGSSLRGDIEVNAALANPISVSARGQLSGNNLLVPLGTEKALVEQFNIEASGDSVLVRSADLHWGKSRLAVSGKVTGAKDALQVDLDMVSDQLDWEEFQRSFEASRKQQQENSGSIPAVEGVIRLKADRFRFERFDLHQLETTAAISPSGFRAKIDRGVVCGIDTTGRLDVADKEIGLDLQLSATDAQLEPTTICLTNRENQVKGTYSLTARIAGSGDRAHLQSSLKGDFQLRARDGEFIRAPGIESTFDYLNATGDFKVAFPDLERETFPYSFVGMKGRIEGEVLIGDEVNVESPQLNLSGQGKVDLERMQIDAKALVAVLKPVDDVIARIPVIGTMLGGSLIGIPIRITGSLDRPEVTYLSPTDVGVELLNIPLRILKMPLGAVRLFTPSGDERDKNSK